MKEKFLYKPVCPLVFFLLILNFSEELFVLMLRSDNALYSNRWHLIKAGLWELDIQHTQPKWAQRGIWMASQAESCGTHSPEGYSPASASLRSAAFLPRHVSVSSGCTHRAARRRRHCMARASQEDISQFLWGKAVGEVQVLCWWNLTYRPSLAPQDVRVCSMTPKRATGLLTVCGGQCPQSATSESWQATYSSQEWQQVVSGGMCLLPGASLQPSQCCGASPLAGTNWPVREVLHFSLSPGRLK